MTINIHFIADLHLGHKKILEFGDRTHDSLEDMHIAMVEQWNTKVRKNKDIVYVLGDACLNMDDLKWLNMMNGQKRLILGNHDTFHYDVYRDYFKEVLHFHKAYKGIVLTHIPVHPGELENRSTWKYNVHGHIHDHTINNLGPKYLNVNVDILGNYAPLTLDEVREQLAHNEVPGNLYR